MTDREILEMAAKAAGHEYAKHGGYIVVDGIPGNWNPLTDDGDALRLAVKLDILEQAASMAQFQGIDDPYAATRRAIVRAAAAIGKAMP